MTVRSVLRWTFFPLLLTAALMTTLAGIREGMPATAVVMATIFGAAIPILVAQHLMPAEQTWRGRPQDFGIDLLHMAVTGLATEGWRALTVGLMTAGALWLQQTVAAAAAVSPCNASRRVIKFFMV